MSNREELLQQYAKKKAEHDKEEALLRKSKSLFIQRDSILEIKRKKR